MVEECLYYTLLSFYYTLLPFLLLALKMTRLTRDVIMIMQPSGIWSLALEDICWFRAVSFFSGVGWCVNEILVHLLCFILWLYFIFIFILIIVSFGMFFWSYFLKLVVTDFDGCLGAFLTVFHHFLHVYSYDNKVYW